MRSEEEKEAGSESPMRESERERERQNQPPDASYHGRARSDAARLPRRGTTIWRGRKGGGRGGGSKDAHSFLGSRGPLLISKVFPFVPREIRTPYADYLPPWKGMRSSFDKRTPRSSYHVSMIPSFNRINFSFVVQIPQYFLFLSFFFFSFFFFCLGFSTKFYL